MCSFFVHLKDRFTHSMCRATRRRAKGAAAAVCPRFLQESMDSAGGWFMKRATKYYDKKLGMDPSTGTVDSWCSSNAASSFLKEHCQGTSTDFGRTCQIAAVWPCFTTTLLRFKPFPSQSSQFSEVQLALNWGIALQQMWDFQYDFKKLFKNDEARASCGESRKNRTRRTNSWRRS